METRWIAICNGVRYCTPNTRSAAQAVVDSNLKLRRNPRRTGPDRDKPDNLPFCARQKWEIREVS